MAADPNLVKKSDLKKIRETDYAFKFTENINKLADLLGVSSLIKKPAGTVIKAYKANGQLVNNGAVAEGDVIPLSHWQVDPVTIGETAILKWAKATSIEAITNRGYDQAVNMTTKDMVSKAQNAIRTNFFGILANGQGTASGTGVQAALADAWGQLQVLFDDTAIETVIFMNPLDVADYLGTAPVGLAQAMGLSYIENFLGIGTVVMSAAVPKGTAYATAKGNVNVIYVDAKDEDISKAWDFTTDASGLIGIHEGGVYENMTNVTTIISGVTFYPERLDGVIVTTIQ